MRGCFENHMSNVTYSDQGKLCLRNLGFNTCVMRDGHRRGHKLGLTFIYVNSLSCTNVCDKRKYTHNPQNAIDLKVWWNLTDPSEWIRWTNQIPL